MNTKMITIIFARVALPHLHAQDTERMIEWFDLQLLGKQPTKAFTMDVSSLPSTPVQKAKNH